MEGSGFANGSTAVLVDSLKAADRDMARAQARRARLMVEVADARKKADRLRIAELESEGADARYRPGEFAATEIGLAVTTSKHHVERAVSMTRRLQSETPDVWDAWVAGDIDELKAHKVNHALLRLVRDESKRLLNMVVLPVAITRTPELLGRWLNQFVAQAEPDESDERIRRSLEDRYVSVRPDLDGVSFLSACMSSLDAQSVDLLLEALAQTPEPADSRTKQQRRADVLVDLLLGRISNGWHGPECLAVEGCADDRAEGGDVRCECRGDAADVTDIGAVADVGDGSGPAEAENERVAVWNDDDDWDLPASAFRPDPAGDPQHDPELEHDPDPETGGETDPETGSAEDARADEANGRAAGESDSGSGDLDAGPAGGRPRPLSCPGEPVPRVTIGVVVSVQSLLGFTDTPGQLADRSALVPAQLIRELADQPGTLFHRLLTDPSGNLLEVAEMGRFPSGKLAAAVRYRDGLCTNPACHRAAQRCDLDHVVPWPEGPTAGSNLEPKCRPDHRAKTHAGFTTKRTGMQTTWTTPTGHRYTQEPDPFPVQKWPPDDRPALDTG